MVSIYSVMINNSLMPSSPCQSQDKNQYVRGLYHWIWYSESNKRILALVGQMWDLLVSIAITLDLFAKTLLQRNLSLYQQLQDPSLLLSILTLHSSNKEFRWVVPVSKISIEFRPNTRREPPKRERVRKIIPSQLGYPQLYDSLSMNRTRWWW